MDIIDQLNYLDNFKQHYKYDNRYLREVLESSIEAYKRFNDFMPLSQHREKITNDEYWTAKLSAIKAEDCGYSLQLNIRIALESGIEKNIIESILKNGEDLPEKLKIIYRFATLITAQQPVPTEFRSKVESTLNKAEIIEIGLCVSSARVSPTLKRAMGYTISCKEMIFEL